MSHRTTRILVTLIWLSAVAATAVLFDRAVAEWVPGHSPFDKHKILVVAFDLRFARWFYHVEICDKHRVLASILKLPGNFLFTLAVAFALLLFHPRKRWAALLLVASGLLGGLFYTVAKWLVGRHRPVNGIEPFHLTPLEKGLKGLFLPPPNLSFPSGHATLAFATAAALWILLPRWRWIFGWVFALLASVVCAERVLENAHYVSDVIAGAGFGVLAALLANSLLRQFPTPEARRGFPVVEKQPLSQEGAEELM